MNGQNKSTESNSKPTQQAKQGQTTSEIPKWKCNIKGNISSSGGKVYHVPGGAMYDKTIIDTSKGEKYFCTKEEAEKEGFRASSR
jgi:micrococcal nuclease